MNAVIPAEMLFSYPVAEHNLPEAVGFVNKHADCRQQHMLSDQSDNIVIIMVDSI